MSVQRWDWARGLGLAGAPTIAAVPLRNPSNGRSINLLSDHERQRLAAVASLVRVKKGGLIYREDEPADFLYCVAEGVVMKSNASARAASYVTSFSYAQDVFGLCVEGRYIETASTVTAVSVFQIPCEALDNLLRQEAPLAIHLLCKICDELRRRVYLSALLARKDALGKAAMFIEALARRQTGGGQPTRIFLSMRRSDLANHLGLTLEALGRAFSELESRGILRFRDKRRFEIMDGKSLEEVISGKNRKSTRAAKILI